jgi:hypothetical protein
MNENLRIVEGTEVWGNETWVVLSILGQPEESDFHELSARLKFHQCAPGCRIIIKVVDARELDVIVIAVLLGAFLRAQEFGGRLRVRCSGELYQFLIRTGLIGGDDDWLAGVTAPLPHPPGSRGGRASKPLPNQEAPE